MTPTEAVRLVAVVEQLCPAQRINEFTADAWADVLASIRYADAYEAVVRLAARQPFIAVADICGEVRAIRKGRLEGFSYEPPPGEESGRVFLARYRAQLAATADGKRSAGRPPALTGGPHPAVAALLADAVRQVPAKDAEQAAVPRPGVYGVECPECGALVGRRCRSSLRSRELASAHRVRGLLARGEPLPDREAEEREIARRREISRQALAQLPPDAVIEPQDGFRKEAGS